MRKRTRWRRWVAILLAIGALYVARDQPDFWYVSLILAGFALAFMEAQGENNGR